MKSFKIKAFLILILPFLIVSCSVVKKNGMYQSKRYKHKTFITKTIDKKASTEAPIISINNSTKLKTSSDDQHKVEKEKTVINVNDIILPKNIRRAALFSLLSKTNTPKPTVQNSEFFSNEDSCDLMVLKNGDEIEAKVTEISTSTIKYKRCNHLTGPTVIIDKADVLFVKYSNGTKEVFNTVSDIQEQRDVELTKPVADSGSPALRVVGVLLIIIGALFILVVSILVGLIILGLGLLFLSAGK
jgi:hypothetical protein